MLIDTFVNAIFLYDDKMVITFNYKDGTDTITFDDLKAALDKEKRGSDLDCLTAPPGRAWSRYALRVLSFTGCTSRVLAGIFLSPVDSVTLDAIRIGFSVIFLFQSRFKVYLFHLPNTAER